MAGLYMFLFAPFSDKTMQIFYSCFAGFDYLPHRLGVRKEVNGTQRYALRQESTVQNQSDGSCSLLICAAINGEMQHYVYICIYM